MLNSGSNDLRDESVDRPGSFETTQWSLVLAAGLGVGCSTLDERQRTLIFQPSDATWGGAAYLASDMQEVWIPFDSRITGQSAQLNGLWAPGDDAKDDAVYLANKIVALRIFDDEQGKMNLSLKDSGGSALVVSQFTLYGDTRRGRRPSFIDAAPPVRANRLYEYFVSEAKKQVRKVATGRFQAMMDVQLINSGPVTILIDSQKIF